MFQKTGDCLSRRVEFHGEQSPAPFLVFGESGRLQGSIGFLADLQIPPSVACFKALQPGCRQDGEQRGIFVGKEVRQIGFQIRSAVRLPPAHLEPGRESGFGRRDRVIPDRDHRSQQVGLYVSIPLADDLGDLIAERPPPPGDSGLPEPPKNALEADPHEARGGSALGRSEDLRERLDRLLVEWTVSVVQEDQGVTVFGETKRHGTRTGIERVLDQFEKVEPAILEGQLECAQCATPIRRSIERPVFIGQLFDE